MGLGQRLKGLFRSEPSRGGQDDGAALTLEAALKPAALPPGDAIYAIGDIHGRADLLDRLVQLIAHDMADETRTTLVFLGDYVDRGEQSREVIDHCIDLQQAFRGQTVFLKGNHEDAMLSFLEDPVPAANWLTFGGLSTLMSFGVRGITEKMSDVALEDARNQLADGLTDAHLDFLDGLKLTYSIPSHFFCHAGIDPGRSLDAQPPRVLMWGMRDAFNYAGLGRTVVHGHYVTDAPEVATNRISIDTGAYFSSRLTALKLTSEEASFIAT